MEEYQLIGTAPRKEAHRSRAWRLRWAMSTAVLIAAVIHLPGGGVATGAGGVAHTGLPAPDFTLQLLDGKSVALASLKGKPVVVNFWHSG